MSKTKQDEFLKLYKPIHERFERFCRARVYGTMDFRDLINETLLIAFDKFESLKSKDAFLSFLFGISVRILRNHHVKRREHAIPLGHHEFIPDPATNGAVNADVSFLYEALSKISEEQKEALILFEISGFSIREITVIQNASESAVKQRLKRGREKLAEILTFDATTLTKERTHE